SVYIKHPENPIHFNVELKGKYTAKTTLPVVQKVVPKNQHKHITFSSFRSSNINYLIAAVSELGDLKLSILMDDESAAINEVDDSFIKLDKLAELIKASKGKIKSIGLWQKQVTHSTLQTLVSYGVEQVNIFSINRLQAGEKTTSYPTTVAELSHFVSMFSELKTVWFFVDSPNITQKLTQSKAISNL
ncbi:hypothetical protein DID80_07475, partial [Candidatus Marinamargulisbacteria bacterium SCGC AAA071-K20]